MKRLISILAIFINMSFLTSFQAYSSTIPDIVAVVNDHSITSYDLIERKKMIRAINNIEEITPTIDQKLTSVALKTLVDEELLFQHAKNIKGKISAQEIQNAINSIEDKNQTPRGYLPQFFASHGVNLNSFRSQIKAELIKMNILSQFSRSVTITPKEIDAIILTDNQRDVNVNAMIFTSNDKTKESFKKMSTLQKKIKNCDNVKKNMYGGFADMQNLIKNLSGFDSQTQNIVKDLPVNKPSNVIEGDIGFKIILLCKKEIKLLDKKENELVENFLINKKVTQQAAQFLANLRKKARIQTFVN